MFTGMLLLLCLYVYRNVTTGVLVCLKECYYCIIVCLQECYYWCACMFTGMLLLVCLYVYRNVTTVVLVCLKECYYPSSCMFTGVFSREH